MKNELFRNKKDSPQGFLEWFYIKMMRNLFSPFIKNGKYLKTPKNKKRAIIFLFLFIFILYTAFVIVFYLLPYVIEDMIFPMIRRFLKS